MVVPAAQTEHRLIALLTIQGTEAATLSKVFGVDWRELRRILARFDLLPVAYRRQRRYRPHAAALPKRIRERSNRWQAHYRARKAEHVAENPA